MSDRIDEMTHEELKAATKKLVVEATLYKDGFGSNLGQALQAFVKSPIDKIRESLKANGWRKVGDKEVLPPGPYICIRRGGDEEWTLAPEPTPVTVESMMEQQLRDRVNAHQMANAPFFSEGNNTR